MSRFLTVGAAQMGPIQRSHTRRDVVERMIAHLREARRMGCELVVFPELTQQFGLSPGKLGLLTSAYFITFAVAQLPLGMLMDRYGPRRVNATMLLVAAAGAVVFSMAPET